MIRSFRAAQQAAAHRGATLTEVLMSLLIMSIGIVSVITMFPIAVLRSIQATQLTNSRMMTENTEQAFRTMFRTPAGSDTYKILDYHYDPKSLFIDAQFRGNWRSGTAYLPGHIVSANAPKGSHLPSREPWLVCVGALTSPGVSGNAEPAWATGAANRLSPAQDEWDLLRGRLHLASMVPACGRRGTTQLGGVRGSILPALDRPLEGTVIQVNCIHRY
jgi:Tfp pilus assembly protein PilV